MIGDFAIVTMNYSGSCWNNNGYSDADFPARVGILTDMYGNATFENAFFIDSPQIEATEFAASSLNLYFKPMYGNTSYSIWAHDGDVIELVGSVTREDVEASWGKNVAPLEVEFEFEYVVFEHDHT